MKFFYILLSFLMIISIVLSCNCGCNENVKKTTEKISIGLFNSVDEKIWKFGKDRFEEDGGGCIFGKNGFKATNSIHETIIKF